MSAMERPDGLWAQVFDLKTATDRPSRAVWLSCVGAASAYVLNAAGHIAKGPPLMAAPERAALHDSLMSASPMAAEALGGIADFLDVPKILEEAVQHLIASYAMDPAILDKVAEWVAPYLSEA